MPGLCPVGFGISWGGGATTPLPFCLAMAYNESCTVHTETYNFAKNLGNINLYTLSKIQTLNLSQLAYFSFLTNYSWLCNGLLQVKWTAKLFPCSLALAELL